MVLYNIELEQNCLNKTKEVRMTFVQRQIFFLRLVFVVEVLAKAAKLPFFCVCVYMRACMCVHVYTCVSVCLCVCMHMLVSVNVLVCNH